MMKEDLRIEGEKKRQPERPAEISEDPKDKVQPAQAMQSAREKNQQMLQIALAPAAIPLRVLDQRLRTFLVAAPQVVSQPHIPVVLHHQGGLDEIMAQNLPAKRLFPGYLRQPAKQLERSG